MPDAYGNPTEAERRQAAGVNSLAPAQGDVPWGGFNTFSIPQTYGGVSGHYNLRGPQTVTTSGSLQDWANTTLRGDTVLQGTDSRNGRAYATLDPNRYFYAHEVLGQPLSDAEKKSYIDAYTYERHATEKPPDWMTKNGKYVALAALAAIGGAGAAGVGAGGGAAAGGAGAATDAGLGATVGAAAPATGVIGGGTGAVGGATALGTGELAGGIGAAGAAAGSAGSSGLGAAAGGLQQTSGLGYFANGGAGGIGGVGGGNTGALASSGGIAGGSGTGIGGTIGSGSSLGAAGGGMGFGDWANLAGQLYGAYSERQGARDATNAQLQGNEAAVNELRRQFDLNRSDQMPWLTAGTAALGRLNDPAASFTASPDYAFVRGEGTRDIGNTFSARGGAQSGNALRALDQFNTGEASKEFGNWWNQQAGLAGVGQASAQSLGALGTNSANNISNVLSASGNARASGIQDQTNALTGGISDLLSFYNKYRNRNAAYPS